jgi:hypothetical protein
MFDRIFSPALAFCLLIGAALAITAAWFEPSQAASTNVIRLPVVEIVAKRPLPRTELAQTGAAQASGSVQRSVQ